MSNLQVALDFLSKFPDAKLFPSRWGKPKGSDKPTHCPLVAWSTESSSDPEQIRRWMEKDESVYACIALAQSDMSCLDVDNKNGKDGRAELVKLELEHGDLPETMQGSTPSGGDHYLFLGACATGANKFGRGLDSPVMIPVPGSNAVGKGVYRIVKNGVVAQLPAWLKSMAGERKKKEPGATDTVGIELDLPHNIETALHYLEAHPGADEGCRDATAYQVACKVREYAISQDKCLELMLDEYGPKSGFGAEGDAIIEKCVASAYRGALKPIGAAAPEIVFADIECPEPELTDIERLNKEFAVAVIGAKTFILRETKDDVVPLRKSDFETLLQNQRTWIEVGGKPKCVPLSKIWLESPERRHVKGICFSPKGCKDGWINLWRGFAVDPAGVSLDEAAKKCALYRKHVEQVICSGDQTHIKYVWAWLADLVQNPGGRKPGVALVLRGGRGTGKGMFSRPLMQIVGRHGIQLNNREHLTGRFNHHLADKILVFLDEAFWAGDKKSEGVLKGLITEPRIAVERKGVDTYPVDSYVRCIMASNEDWVVPAGPDERRFLVLDVADTHKQDSTGYFKALANEIDNGGTEALLTWLLAYDGSDVDLFHAPESSARLDQKMESLEPVHAWWLECLYKGVVYDHEWPEFLIPRLALYAYKEWAKAWPGNTYISSEKLARKIYGAKGVCPGFRSKGSVGGEIENGYRMPTLEEARKKFEAFLGGAVEWERFDDLWVREHS